ncbi:hypothetical protein EVAR_37738_1 [Eumeta japonica]|uniref:Uncharacterized protein n=1 Tax=Eumeta variegata TaxID=151549 RepID=A0A4C1WPA1_EUMVA|nr:hypothetical protein EVAR_37738_1 [Eumeta japonica]
MVDDNGAVSSPRNRSFSYSRVVGLDPNACQRVDMLTFRVTAIACETASGDELSICPACAQCALFYFSSHWGSNSAPSGSKETFLTTELSPLLNQAVGRGRRHRIGDEPRAQTEPAWTAWFELVLKIWFD